MIDHELNEQFARGRLDPALRWHCEPAAWGFDSERRRLWLEPNAGTDFWQRTHYGFEADNGHFLYLDAAGDFLLTTKVTFRPVHQYDQAGLMVRISTACWLKTSVEFEPGGPNRLGVVVTNGQYSDWSTQPLAPECDTVWHRVSAEAGDYRVESSLDGIAWQQLRLARLLGPVAGSGVACGLYACSPKGAGYRAEFHFLKFTPARAR